MAGEIRRDYPDGVHLIAVLKGAFVFLSDLVRAMHGHCSLDFMAVSSYGKGTSVVRPGAAAQGSRHGLEGKRRRHRRRHRRHRADAHLPAGHPARARPRSLRTACLLSKPSRRQVDVKVEYVGFTIEDKFVVGYGLDYAEQYRNLPYIAVLDE